MYTLYVRFTVNTPTGKETVYVPFVHDGALVEYTSSIFAGRARKAVKSAGFPGELRVFSRTDFIGTPKDPESVWAEAWD